MPQKSSSLFVTIAGVFIAILGGIAYFIFSGAGSSRFPSLPTLSESPTASTQPAAQPQKLVQPKVLSDSSKCADSPQDQVGSCCQQWADAEGGINYPKNCQVEWRIGSNKQCVFVCAASPAPAP